MKTTKLAKYLTLATGAGFAATSADAAITVTFYGPGAQSPSTDPATPLGINFGLDENYFYNREVDSLSSSNSYFAFQSGVGHFTRGIDVTADSTGTTGWYFWIYGPGDGFFERGAVFGSENYANISFDGNDGIFEAVGQFFFDGAGGGYLIALTIHDDGSALSISDGKAAIDAIPEPSALALLALGSAGLLARRRREKAA